MSIQRELSEFSTAYNQNFPTGPFPTAGSFPQQTGPFPGSGNSLYPSEVSSTATASFLRSSHGKISSKHSMFTQLNSTSNFFLHSELSPFQPLWRDNNRFPFHQGYVAGFMTSADFPKWYDSPMYKEMTLEQQFHGFRGFTETGSRPQHKPLEAVAPPPQLRSTSTMLQKASAVEKHSDYESAGHCPPWKRAQSVGSNRYPSLRPSTISPTNERPRRGQDAVSSLNEFRRTEQVAKLTAEQSVTMLINSSAPRDAVDGIDNRATSFSNKVSTVAVQQAVVTSNTPFNITQLLTPVIHNQQDTESTPEGLQMAHNQPAIMGERERRGPTPEVRMASYKSRASGLLFNLKDNRKRVKSTYSPTKFTGMEVTGRSKSNLGGYGLRDTVVDNLDALDIVVPQLAGEREPSAVCQPQTNPQCDPSRQPTTAHHLQHLNYTDTSEAGAYQALRSSQTREEMVHHQEYRGNYHNSNLPTTHQNDPCELAIPSPAVIDSIQTSDVNRTTERYSKGSGYEQVRGKQYGSIDASSQESWKQHVSNTTYHGRETFGVNERVTDMRPWKGEIAALIEKDKQSLLSRTAATMKQEPKQNYDWNVVNGQDEMREPGKQYVPEGRVHSAAEVLTGRNSLPHKEVRPISDYTKNQNDWCRSAGQDNIKTSVNLESDRTYAVRNTFTERGQPVHAKPHGLWVEQNKRHQVYVNKEQYDQDVQWNSSYKNDNRQYSANASTSARWGKDHSENTDNTITMLHQTVGKYPRNEAFTANDLDGMHMKVLAKAEKANVKAEQMKAELPKAEHSKAEKAKSDLKNADKPKAELAKAEDTLALAKTENTKAELSKADIAKAQAVVAQTELAKAELAIAQAELAKAELAKAQAELAKAELVKAQADLAKAELAKAQAEEVKAEHTKTEQAEAELAKCKRAKEEKVKAELATAHLPKAELVQEKVAISKAELANAEKAKHFEQTEQAIIKPEKAKNDDPAKFTSWSNSEDRYGINDILTTRDYEQVKRERLGEKRYSVNDAVPTTVDKVSNEIISTQAEIKPPLQKDVAPISSYEQEDRGQDEYTGFREQNGFSHEVSAKENKHRSIEVAATDESKKIDSPATINHETAITTTGYTKDESISNQRLGTKVEEQVLGNQKENSERRSEGPWVYSESSKQFKLASQTESRRKPSDQSLPLSKEVHPSSFRPMSLKEKGQTKQQLLTSKLKAQAEKEISAIKEKGFGKQDGLLLRNPTKHLEQRERGQSGQESKIIKHYVSKGQTNNDLCINNATAQSQHKGKATIEESTVSDDQQSITSLKGTRNKSQVNDGTEKDMLQSTEVKSQNEYNSDEISCKMFSGKSESVSEDDSLQIMGIMVTITEPSQEKEDGFITQQKVKGNEKREDEAIQNKLPYNNSESDPTITPKADQAALSKSGVSSKRQDSAFADHVIPEKTRQQTQLSDGKAEIQTEHAARESKQVTLAPETTNSYPENTEKPPSNGSDQFQKEILVHDSSAVKDGRFAEVKQAKNKQLAETQPLFFKQGITESNNLTTTEIIGKGDSSFQDAPVENIHIGSIAVCVVAGTHQTDNQQNTESHSVAKHVVSGAEKPTGDSNVHIDSIAIRVVSGVTENENGKTTANEKANNSADPTGETSSFKPEVSSRQKQLPTVPTAIADYARLKVISTEEDSPSKTDSPSREDGYFPMIQTRRSRRPVFPPEQHEQPVAGVMLGKEVAAVKEPEVPYKLNTATKIGGVLSSMEQQQRKTGMFSLREKAKEAISLNKEGLTGTTDTDIFKHNNVPEHATGLENHPEYQSTQTAHEPGKQRFSPKVDATQYMEAMQVSLGNEYTMEKREEQSKVEERTKREKEDIKEVERTALQRNKERVAREDEEYQKEKERREQHKQKEEKRKEAERKEKERREEEKKEMEKRELQKQREEEKKEAEQKEAERKEKERREVERIQKERREEERREKERREEERREKERREEERREKERREEERREKERREAEKIQKERREEERREKERREEERREKERREEERREKERREEERREKERREEERRENEKREAKKKEEEQRKLQKLIEEKKEAEKKEAERKETERKEKEKIEWQRREVERREKERQEKERREAERIEEERREKERKEEERREKERIENERKEKEKREAERIKKEREEERRKEERRENERIEKERIEKERREKERREKERIEEERREKERIEAERKEAERREAKKKEEERRKLQKLIEEKKEAERKEMERREKEKIEWQRREVERREKERQEKERREAERIEEERKEKERKEEKRREKERIEKERIEKERRANERREAERRENERIEAERKENERREEERRKKERIENERKEEERRERERREKERIEKERREAKKKEEERRKLQKLIEEKKEAEQKEAERKETERKEKERREAEKIEKEKKEEERREKERIEKERIEEEKREEECRKQQKRREEAKKEADRKEAERKEMERREKERREQERNEKERIELETKEEEQRKIQKLIEEKKEAEEKEVQRKEKEKKEEERREKERIEKERKDEEKKEEEQRKLEMEQKEAEMKEENRIARLREEERKDKDRRERLREEEKNEEERKELQLQREEEQKEKRRARQREEEKMNALQYYSISSPENQARPRDRPLFSPQPSPHRGNPEDWEYHVRPHLHTSPAPPSTRSNTSSPALGGKPTMFRVKDNTFRSSSLTKSVKPRFHKSLGEEFRVGSPLWSGSERGDEVHERTRESGLEAHRECTGTPEYHESGISSHRQTRVRDTQHAVDHTALSEPTHTQPYSRPYSRRSVVLDDDDSRSMISNMSGDVESYAASVADMSERSSGLYDSEFTSRGCYNRPDSACSFASDVGRPMGKPPTVPPKSDKALRRAKRLTTRRIKKESKPETEVEADPVENPVHAVASVPSSPSELGSSNRPARASAHFSAPVSLPLAPSSISSVPFAPTDLRSSHRQSFYASPNAKAPTSLPHASPHPRVPGQVVSVSSSPTYQPIAHPRHLVSPLASPLTSPMNVPQYHVDPNYTSPSGLSLPQPFTQSLTQKKVLQDPGSGQYFVVDMPVQVKTKTFFDPETGKYVQLNVRQPGQGGSLSQAQPQGYPQSLPEASYIQPPTYPPYTQSKASPAGRPYVLYQGYPQNYQSLPVSSLSTHRSHSGMSVLETPTQDCQNPHPKEESQGWAGDGEGQGEAWSNQGYGGQEQTPYMDTAHDTHSRPGEGTVYGSDANSVPHRDIITMSELEDFAMDSGDWL
uniref:DUF4585 domain-containing protein n=1 Tax=Esox lucius TaxID=8010 RepID=A0AAY5KGS8_ESOLU